MKKLLFSLVLLAGLASSADALSGTHYNIDVTSYPVTETAYMATQIVGNVNIEQIYFSNSSTSTAQTVSVYSLCDSTTTVTLQVRAYLPAGTDSNSVKFEYPLFNTPLLLHDVCFRKSDAASSVHVNVWYR